MYAGRKRQKLMAEPGIFSFTPVPPEYDPEDVEDDYFDDNGE